LLTPALREALDGALSRVGLVAPPGVALEVPRESAHGDYATNVALTLAKSAGKPPRALAEAIVAQFAPDDPLVESVSIAGPGFVNFRLRDAALQGELLRILDEGAAYGSWPLGTEAPVLVEFVSANPTGPMNVVNARAGAVGAALVRLFRAAGRPADAEFYVNDAGRQVDLLGASVLARFAERIGDAARATVPADGYQGAYIQDLAAAAPEVEARRALLAGDEAWFRDFALTRMLESQQRDLAAYGVTFDRWFRESALHEDGRLTRALEDLRARGHVYAQDGATWFRSTTFGDEKDRVLVRQSGEPSYFLADIAYHRDKAERGYGLTLDLWGPDHHGHVARIAAALKALGLPDGVFKVTIVQFVRLLSKGELVKMSKRAGEFVTLADLLEEVGADAAKYFFLMRSTSAHLDFDLDLAREQSNDNPCYYVQYAHARVASVLRLAAEKGVALPADERARRTAAARLAEPEARNVLRLLAQFPDVVKGAAEAEEPQRVPTYLAQVAGAFHQFYHQHRIVTDDAETTAARLLLSAGTRQVIANGLALLGVSAPERM
jgi:arginyl-tRNA synthetase